MTWWQILLIVLAIVAGVLVVLYIVGTRLQRRQAASQEQMEAMKQTVSMLVIDKKKMRLRDANLPEIVVSQTPKYLRRTKMPIVKAKIGPKVMTLIADPVVFEQLPTMKEVKAVISGIYITEIKSVRGGTVLPIPKKKRGLARLMFWKKGGSTPAGKNDSSAAKKKNASAAKAGSTAKAASSSSSASAGSSEASGSPASAKASVSADTAKKPQNGSGRNSSRGRSTKKKRK